MNLYKLSRDVNNDYDTYDSCVVAAESEDDARTIHPSDYGDWGGRPYGSWAKTPDQVKVELIGKAKKGIERGVIVASFNAG